MSIPRRIEPDKIKGYVYCLDFGPLAYEDEHDKQKLIAISELYREGIKKGSIRLDKKTAHPISRGGITQAQFDALQVIWQHGGQNSHLDLKTIHQMKKVAAKRKKEILVLTMKDVRKLGRGWFSWLRPGKK